MTLRPVQARRQVSVVCILECTRELCMSAVSQANVYAPLLANVVAPQDLHVSINTEVVATRPRIAITNTVPCSGGYAAAYGL